MLSIKNLHILIDQKAVVHGINLAISPGTTHALMGPNGSGKSSLALCLMGHPAYKVHEGAVLFSSPRAPQMCELNPDVGVDARAKLGIFLAFQQPYEIPGVQVKTFLKAAYQALHAGEPVMSVADFDALCVQAFKTVGLDEGYLCRNVNEGFSGGEKKRFELAQILILKPLFVILDEIDAGLDIGGLALIAEILAHAKKYDPAFTALIITHRPDLLDVVPVDCVHIMRDGAIVHSGASEEVMASVARGGYAAFGPQG
jgi:Fe-S cluster assembly ATP-binding protein